MHNRISDNRITHSFKVNNAKNCPVYSDNDKFDLMDNLIYGPVGKPSCLTLSANFIKKQNSILNRSKDHKGINFKCSGCLKNSIVTLKEFLEPSLSAEKEELISALQNYSFFQLLRRNDICDLIPDLDITTHDTGEIIINKNEQGTMLYVILSGAVDVLPNDNQTSSINFGAGTVFGEMSLLTGDLTTADVRATSPVSLIGIKHDVVKRLIHHFPKLQRYFFKLLSERVSSENLDSNSSVKFSGNLTDWKLPDILQTLNLNRKSGILDLLFPNNEQGQIIFNSGEIVNVNFRNFLDIDGFFELFKMIDGEFCFAIETEEDNSSEPIGNFMYLMMEAVVRSDENAIQ